MSRQSCRITHLESSGHRFLTASDVKARAGDGIAAFALHAFRIVDLLEKRVGPIGDHLRQV